MIEKTKNYEINFQTILDSKIPLDSTFDESLDDSYFRIEKTIFKRETEYEYDNEFEALFENDERVNDETNRIEEFDIQCFCAHIGKDAEWESIIKYPTFTAHSKARTAYYRIQSKIESMINF